MTESRIHKFLKEVIAKALESEGYTAKMEMKVGGARVDVVAEKDGTSMKIEVVKSHAPDWVFVKVKGDLVPSKPARLSAPAPLKIDVMAFRQAVSLTMEKKLGKSDPQSKRAFLEAVSETVPSRPESRSSS